MLQHIDTNKTGLKAEEVLADSLARLTGGEPLMLRMYAEEISTAQSHFATFSPEQLKHIKPGLKGFFDAWFDDQSRLWGADRPLRELTVRTLLNVCATALGPVRRVDVVGICPEVFTEAWLVDDAAERVRRFLIGDPLEVGYVFSHPRLAEYFSDRLLERHEASTWQDRVLSYCRRSMQKVVAGEINRTNISPYVVRYSCAHLNQAELPSEQYSAVLTQHWYEAWMEVEGTPSGYLSDLQTVWLKAKQEMPNSFPAMARVALFRSSITSVGQNINERLLVECTRIGAINKNLALALMRLQSARNRTWLLIDLIPLFSAAERGAMISEARDAAVSWDTDDINWHPGGPAIASALLSSMATPTEAAELAASALTLARRVGPSRDRARALVNVAANSASGEGASILEEALEVSEQVEDIYQRIGILCSMASLFPQERWKEIILRAAELVDFVEYDHLRKRCWSTLIQSAPADCRDRLLDRALLCLKNGESGPEASTCLDEIATTLSGERQAEVIRCAYKASDRSYDRLPVLKHWGHLLDEDLRTDARLWVATIPVDSEESIAAEVVFSQWEDEPKRSAMLRECASKFIAKSSQSMISERLLEISAMMSSDVDKRETLAAAFRRVQTIDDGSVMRSALANSIRWVPNEFAMVILDLLRSSDGKALLIAANELQRTDLFEEVEVAFRHSCTYKPHLALELLELACWSNDAAAARLADEAVDIFSANSENVIFDNWIEKLSPLALRLPEQISRFVGLLSPIGTAEALIGFLPYLPDERRPESIDLIANLLSTESDSHSIELYAGLADAAFSDAQRAAYLQEAQRRCDLLMDPRQRAQAAEVISMSSRGYYDQWLADLLKDYDPSFRESAEHLFGRFPGKELGWDILRSAKSLVYGRLQVSLVWLALVVSQDQRPPFGWQRGPSWHKSVKVLLNMIPVDLVGAALSLFHHIPADKLPSGMLRRISGDWFAACETIGVHPKVELSHLLGNFTEKHKRYGLMPLISDLAPAIHATCGPYAVQGSCQAMLDSSRIWP